jgi:membrane protein
MAHDAREQHGAPLAPGAIGKIVARHAAAADLPPALRTPHVLRHTFCTAIAERAGLDVAAELAGHADVRTSKRYVTVTARRTQTPGAGPTGPPRRRGGDRSGSRTREAAGSRAGAATANVRHPEQKDMTDSADTDTDSEPKRSGRQPEGPAHPRKGGMMQTLKRTVSEFSEDNLTDAAAALTYYAVLSIFPALLALVSIVGLVGDPQTITKEMTDIVSSIGPASAADTFKGPIQGLTKSSGAAGILLIAGIAAALWTASGYVGAFMRASNVIYEVEEGRSFIKLRPLQMLVTLVLVVLLALVLVALVLTGPVAKQIGSAVGIGSAAVTVWNIAKWPVLFIVVVFMIVLLYYASPNAKLRGLKSIVPGAALAIVIWLMASAGFAFYVANFGSYNKTYGALGGVIVFLVWLWITNVAILLGAELNAERERSRQLKEGTPEAEREIQLEERSQPKAKKRSRTA